ncbi:TonB-dependent hemoglobin/transferrin/lactoferrin family receptor [Neorhizobium sp. LjRoot104]|uniref:TonB-dependent hemoglobin/transferrin/lactoferrin family receptor n=1 Tax=Neorhizobium sp. LjRoot104 TaxID=3342254 RepID=UPI003ECF8FEC
MVTRRLRSTLATCTALALLSLAHGASAQQATQPPADTTLKPIVLKGKRVKAGDPAANTPLASTTTAEDIRKKDIGNLQNLGNTTEPGVDFVESKPGKVGGLFVRGLGGPRVVTLIDNIPVPYMENFARSGSFSATTGISDGSNSFDFSALSGVDVLRGADSSRVGSGTLGGALVLRTLEPEDLIPEGRSWGGVAKLTYDSEDNSFGGSVAVAKKIENTSVLFQGGYKKGHERENQGSDGNIGVNRTEPNPMDFDQNNLMFKLRQDIEGGHRVGLTAERFDLQSDTDLRTIQGTGGTPFTPGDYDGNDDTRRERVSIDYDYEAPHADGLIDAASLTLYWQRLTKGAGSEGSNSAGYYLRDNGMVESSFGLSGNGYSQFEAGGLDHQVNFGGSLQYFNTQQYIAGAPSGSAVNKSDMPDIEGTRFGFYLDDRIEFGGSGFAVTPGLRFDWFDYDPQSTPRFTGTMPEGKDGFRVSPKLLATYQVTPAIELFAQWSMAYRAPTINELFLNFGGTGYSVLGNSNLKPETGHGFELGANYQSGDLSGKLTVFHNRYSNFIEFYGAFPTFSYRNISKVQISGVEIKARKDFANGFYVHGSLAYAYGEDKETGEVLRSVAPLKSILGVGYEQETWGVDLTTILAAAAFKDGGQTPATGGAPYQTFDAPGYGIVNLAGWWEPEQTKGLRIQAGIYNIFDKTYYNALTTRDVSTTSTSTSNQPPAFYSEPGRTFKLSLTQRF